MNGQLGEVLSGFHEVPVERSVLRSLHSHRLEQLDPHVHKT